MREEKLKRKLLGVTESHPGASLSPSYLRFELLHFLPMGTLVDLHAQTALRAGGFSRLLDYRVKHVVCRCE